LASEKMLRNGELRMSTVQPTSTNKSLPVKISGYTSLVDVLEYAAQGETGYNFYDGRGHLGDVLTYADLRDQAKVLARKLLGLGCGTWRVCQPGAANVERLWRVHRCRTRLSR